MSKNREIKRRRKLQKRRSAHQAAPTLRRAQNSKGPVMSAQTMWRTMHVDFSVQEELVATTLRVQPSLWQRDAEKIKRIEQASDVEDVLDLVPTATGVADYAWLKRMRGFGASGADAIAERLTPAAGSAIIRRRKPAFRSAASAHCVGVTMRTPMR